MSWMIVAQHLPLKAKRIEDIPRDFKPNPIGTRAEIAAKVKAIVPTVIFAEDLVEAEFDGPGYSVELSLGEREPSLGVTFFVGHESCCSRCYRRHNRWPRVTRTPYR
jgi:hypothetical protein